MNKYIHLKPPASRHSARLSTSIFSSSVADTLCEEAFERLDNVEDVSCATTPIANGETGNECVAVTREGVCIYI